MESLFSQFSSYVNAPRLVPLQKNTRPIVLLSGLLLLAITFGFLAGMFSGILVKTNLIPSPGPSMLDSKNMGRLEFFIAAVIIAPLMEEAIFRWQLKRFTGSIAFIAFLSGVVVSAVFHTKWGFLFSLPVFAVLFLSYRFTIAASVTRKFKFWKMFFPWHFHLTALSFALVHLANFEKGISLLPFGLLYTLPQFLLGLLLGFTRMNFGLKYAIALHALYNLSFAILLFSKY